MTVAEQNPVPVTVIVEPTCVPPAMVSCSPSATETALDGMNDGTLTTWNAPGPVVAAGGTVTAIWVLVPPGSGTSGPTLPSTVNRFTSGLTKPLPLIVATAPC